MGKRSESRGIELKTVQPEPQQINTAALQIHSVNVLLALQGRLLEGAQEALKTQAGPNTLAAYATGIHDCTEGILASAAARAFLLSQQPKPTEEPPKESRFLRLFRRSPKES